MTHFIKTTDEATKEELLACGYTLMSEQGGVATFLNDGKKQNFTDKTKISFSNVLTM